MEWGSLMGGRKPAWRESLIILFSLIIIVFGAVVASGAGQTFHEPFESAAGVAANGGSLSGGSFVAGVSGNALHLPSSGSLSYPNNGKASIEEGTAVFHFKPQSLSNCGMLGIGTLSTANSFGIFLATHPTWGSRHLVTEIRDSTGYMYQAWSHEVQPDTDTWICIAATWDCDSGFRTYANGVGGYTRSINICDKFSMSNQIDIGRTGWYSDCNGIYDEMKFFDYKLSASEIGDVCSLAVCSGSSDCGEDGLVGSPYCSGGDSYQDYRAWMCHNPGQPDAYCSSADTPQLQEDCGEDSCGSWGANYCKGDYVYHSRACHDRGCFSAECYDYASTEEGLVETCSYGCENGACAGEKTRVYVSPEETMVPLGAGFSVSVAISATEGVYAGQFELVFNPEIVKVTGIEEGDFLNKDGADTFTVIDIDNVTGKVSFADTRFNTPDAISGSGSLAVIEMVSVGQGSSDLGLDNAMLSDNQVPPNQIPVEVANGSVEVRMLAGDVNGDCVVNIFDLAAVGLAYGKTMPPICIAIYPPPPECWPDVNGDGRVDIFDLATVGLNYGMVC